MVAAAVLAAALSAVSSTVARAAVTISVPSQVPTIQAAIDLAGSGDTVLVGPGTYFENIDFRGKDITVASSGGWAQTVIDGRGLGPIVRFSGGETNAAVLRGFTVQHGVFDIAQFFLAGGVAAYLASPTIEQNVVVDNVGAGISVWGGGATIRSNLIVRNGSTTCTNCAGGGISVMINSEAAPVDITGNWIQDNVNDQGGGVGIDWGGPVNLIGNVFYRNRAAYDGGGFWETNDTTAVIVGNWFVQNTAEEGTALYLSALHSEPALLNANLAYSNISMFQATPTDGATVFVGQVFAYLANNGIAAEPDHPLIRCAVRQLPGLVAYSGGNKLVTQGTGTLTDSCQQVSGTP